MKIQCDVCEKGEATLFCVADEAAVCAACDHRVHHANKLAGKHQRFSLHHPSPKEATLCDICQERMGFLFCRQDRAILCSECDTSIHKASQHMLKHTRFLLAGIKLSANPTPHSGEPPPPPQQPSESAGLTNSESFKIPDDPPASVPPHATGAAAQSAAALMHGKTDSAALAGFDCSVSASSISEYLRMLPGWHVEDLLDSSSSSPSPYGFSKNLQTRENDQLFKFWDEAEIGGNMSGFCPGKMGFAVPQMHLQTHNQSYEATAEMGFGLPNGFNDQQLKEFAGTYDTNITNTTTTITTTTTNNNNNTYNNIMGARKRSEDNSFAVPQFNPYGSVCVSKRLRSLYYYQT